MSLDGTTFSLPYVLRKKMRQIKMGLSFEFEILFGAEIFPVDAANDEPEDGRVFGDCDIRVAGGFGNFLDHRCILVALDRLIRGCLVLILRRRASSDFKSKYESPRGIVVDWRERISS